MKTAKEEEERRAFEKAVENNSFNAKWFLTQYRGREAMFELWLAAKAHAKESVKPTVKIIPSTAAQTSYPYIVSLFEGDVFNGVLEDFRTEEDAKDWAVANGYQVVE
jgi:hypothetical protein